MCRRKCQLLDFRKVVVWISVECEPSNLTERNIRVRPDFCDIKDVPAVLFGVDRIEDLNLQRPRRKFATLDGREEILSRMVRIFGGYSCGFIICERTIALVGDKV